MLKVICGEDNVSSRQYYLDTLKSYSDKGYELKTISFSDLGELAITSGSSSNLFGFKQVYSIENLNRSLSRRTDSAKIDLLKKIDQKKDIILLDWENSLSTRDLKFKGIGVAKEFKPDQNIFKLLEACTPSNLEKFLSILTQIVTVSNEMFLYVMLVRHLKKLTLVKIGDISTLSGLQDWQKRKLQNQAEQWPTEKLLSFFDKLLNLDVSLKTGASIYGLRKSIEMLSCYYIS